LPPRTLATPASIGLKNSFGEVSTELGHFHQIGNEARVRRLGIFPLDLNGALESCRAGQFCNERRPVLQRPSRIIARFGGDGLECIEKRGSRSGVRLEWLRPDPAVESSAAMENTPEQQASFSSSSDRRPRAEREFAQSRQVKDRAVKGHLFRHQMSMTNK